MNRIYLCEDEKNIRNVYGDNERVYTKAEILNAPELFQDTAYVFSTWGMVIWDSSTIIR